MIAKKFRLTQREVKKALTRWRPFFAYGIVLNQVPNREWYNRFWIVIWAKSVNTNVTRVFFRRRFFDTIRDSKLFVTPLSWEGEGLGARLWKWTDYVFVVKKQMQLDRKEVAAIKSFEKDLNFLINKVK